MVFGVGIIATRCSLFFWLSLWSKDYCHTRCQMPLKAQKKL